MRTLDVLYRWRDLNFKENGQLRELFLKDAESLETFGKSSGDFVKSLPSMSVTVGAGAIAVDQAFNLPDWQWWLVGAGLAGVGFILQTFSSFFSLKRRRMQSVQQDFERNLYYKNYLDRVKTALVATYSEIEEAHRKAFGSPYSVNEITEIVVEKVLSPLKGHECPFLNEHMRLGKITPTLWARCETGGEGAWHCPIWPSRRPPSPSEEVAISSISSGSPLRRKPGVR